MILRRQLILRAIDETPIVPSPVSVMINDGTLVNSIDIADGQYSKDDIVGFVISEGDINIIVHPDDSKKCYFCGAKQSITEYEIKYGGAVNQAVKDMDGRTNTELLCKDITASMHACNEAASVVWKNGYSGYLPAFGELRIITDNIDELNNVRLKCGCSELQKTNYWSSTLNALNEEGFLEWTYIADLHGYYDGGRVQGFYEMISITKLEK